MASLKLSILTPAVPSRLDRLHILCAYLSEQIKDLPVEHLSLIDNKKRTVGEKRDALLRAAKGDYVAFVDDDDWITADYVSSLLEAAKQNPDVITFRQDVVYNGKTGEVQFKLGNPNEPFKPNGVTKRNAWHVCAWRRTLAIQSRFPASNYGEDWAYAERLCSIQGLKEVHIDRSLHTYIHDAKLTEAPEPSKL